MCECVRYRQVRQDGLSCLVVAPARLVLKFLFLSRGISFRGTARGPIMERNQVMAQPSTNGNVPAVQLGTLLQLSNEMVRIYKEIFGRGPTRARADWAGPDTLLCTLEDSLTPPERKMTELGEHQRVREIRTFFQHTCEANFRESVERITGRKIRAFVSGIDTGKDVSSEVFYFERKTD